MSVLSGYPLRAMREAERGDEGAVLRRCIDSLAAAMRRYGQCAEAHAEGISQQVRSNQPNVSTSSSRLISISKFFFPQNSCSILPSSHKSLTSASKYRFGTISCQIPASSPNILYSNLNCIDPSSRTSFADLYDTYKKLLPADLARLDPRLFCKVLKN